MRRSIVTALILAGALTSTAQDAPLKTAAEVLDRYKEALGGADAIAKVQSETIQGEVEGTGITFTQYSKPFKTLMKAKLADGKEVLQGFDGKVTWSVSQQGASIDKDTPVESARRDADLQYALHQPDYFTKLELAGVTDFEGHRCYWLHGTTHWGKDNHQFYDVKTGLLVGYRFQIDSASSDKVAIVVFDDYKNFGGRLVATKNISHSNGQSQTYIFKSVSYEPLDDAVFDPPLAVKALMK